MKISYAIPVCNEHLELDRLLGVLTRNKRDVDEIVVQCDQGNTTLEVYKVLDKYAKDIRVIEFALNGDFASFKNNLKNSCQHEWVFQIDADEYLHDNFIQNLHTILQANPDVEVIWLPRNNTVEGLTDKHIQQWRWRVDDRGRVNFPDYQCRILQNTPKIQWVGKVHEVLVGQSTQTQFPMDDICCIQHPKHIDRQEVQNKFYDTLTLCDIKVVGITRVRNEEEIIQHTLDHVSNLVDEIYVYDDCSTDNTVAICEAHPKVAKVIKGTTWQSDSDGRHNAEGSLRQKIYEESLKSNPDWVYYFDADEFADFDGIDLTDKNVDSYFLRLFDYYITKDDVDTHFLERKWMGPEYRDIMMLFRPTPNIFFRGRQPSGFSSKYKQAGYVKHYGKAITIEEWEKTCDYYINHRGGDKRPEFTNKWKSRKGKAIHDKSDFGNDLVQWEQRNNPNVIINNSQGQAEKI